MSAADSSAPAWTRPEFEERLREKGRAYHIHHPFNVMLNSGAANPEQIRGWVANRYYYQISIPLKDAAILANCPDREVRRSWVQRILDHDGYGDDPRRHRIVVTTGRGGGARARSGGEARRRIAWRALRSGCVRELRKTRAVAGSCLFFADGAVRAGDSQAASRQLARALPVDRSRRPQVLFRAGSASRGATWNSASPSHSTGSIRARPRSVHSRSCSSSSTCCGR